MKTVIAVLVALIAILNAGQVFGQPIIIYPTNNSVIYNGDQVDIMWTPRSNGWNVVMISLQDEASGTLDWIAFAVTNSGTFHWNARKWATDHTRFQLAISDGGNSTNSSSVHITIPNGPRPVLVPANIRRAVSIEWTAVVGHTYQVDRSFDLVSWEKVAEGTVDFVEAYFMDYAEDPKAFYRVLDLSP